MPTQANKRDDLILDTFAFCSVKARRLSAYSMASNIVATAVEVPLLDADLEWDTDEMWDAANAQIVITRIGVSGIVIMTATLEYEANATGGRGLFPFINSVQNSTCISVNAGASKPTRINLTVALFDTQIGDTFKVYGFQDSGGNLNVTYASLEVRVLP